eukprot:4811470-Amphidinium_carterae.1
MLGINFCLSSCRLFLALLFGSVGTCVESILARANTFKNFTFVAHLLRPRSTRRALENGGLIEDDLRCLPLSSCVFLDCCRSGVVVFVHPSSTNSIQHTWPSQSDPLQSTTKCICAIDGLALSFLLVMFVSLSGWASSMY